MLHTRKHLFFKMWTTTITTTMTTTTTMEKGSICTDSWNGVSMLLLFFERKIRHRCLSRWWRQYMSVCPSVCMCLCEQKERREEKKEMAIGRCLCRCKQYTNMVKEVDLRKHSILYVFFKHTYIETHKRIHKREDRQTDRWTERERARWKWA